MTELFLLLRRPSVLILLILTAMPGISEHIPSARTGEFDYQFRINLAKDYGSLEPVAEVSGRIEEGEFRYRSLLAGAYYRFHKNLKAGGFYTLLAGARHDDDWVGDPSRWWWEKTTDRPEQLLSLDVSPRFLLASLPGENWVFMLKNRYIFNTYNGHQTLMVRPGLTYVHIQDREPIFNIGFHYGVYLPLNFSEVLIYEHDPYVNLIYHVNRRVKLELFGAWRFRTWSTSEDVSDAGESGYRVQDRVFVLGTGLIVRL